jgi:hypothetical protein
MRAVKTAKQQRERQRLGLIRQRLIDQLIARHWEALKRHGTVACAACAGLFIPATPNATALRLIGAAHARWLRAEIEKLR